MRGKVILLVILIALVALVPAVVSAEGADVEKGILPYNGFLSVPLDCSVPGGHIAYFWLREGPVPFGDEDDYLLEGIAIRAPEKAKAFDEKPEGLPDVMSFKAEGAQAFVWPVEDLAEFCFADGTLNIGGLVAYWRITEGMWLWEVDEQDAVSVKWNLTWTDTLYKDSLVATGKRLTYRSFFVAQGEGGVLPPDGVLTGFKDITKVIWH